MKDETTENTVHWNNFNIPIEEKYFHTVHKKITDYLNRKDEIWVRDCYACADPRYRLNIRVITEKPWTNLFAYNMFLRPTEEELDDFIPDWHVICAPGLKLDPKELNTEELEFELIDHGLEEMGESTGENGEEVMVLRCAFTDFGAMQKALEEKGLNTLSAEVEWIPTTTVSLDEEQAQEVLKLVDKLEQDEDVQKVFHNLA